MDRVRLFAVGLALILSILAPLYFAACAFVVKSHFVSWEFGLGTLILKGAPPIFLAALGVTIIAALLSFFVQPRGGRTASVLCIGILTVFGVFLFSMIGNAKSLPPIHDVSTDLKDRPVFSEKVLALRDFESNSLDETTIAGGPMVPSVYAGKSVFGVQQKAYPELKPMRFAVAPDTAFDGALQALQKTKMTIVNADKSAGIIEATAETRWFGITQDAVIRIRPTDTGSVIDIRSASRTGAADLGANAKTVKTLLQAIKAQLSGA